MEMEKPVKLIATLIVVSIISFWLTAYVVGINSMSVIITGIVILVFAVLFHQDRRFSEFKVPVVPDKYRIYLAILLTIISILSILPLSQKVIETPIPNPSPPYSSSPIPLEKHSPVLPQILVVSVLTVFVAITTYMRKFYPYSIIFTLALLGVVYTIIPIIPMPVIFIIPILVIAASASWQHEKVGMAYPLAYAAVLGIIAGIEAPTSYIGWDMLGVVFLTLGITFLSGILTILLFIFRPKTIWANDFNTALRITLSLVVFFIVMNLAYSHIFQPFYNPLGMGD
jgi:hypothetical protein